MKFIGDKLKTQFGDLVDVKYVWNIMDFGYKAEEILFLVESGILTLGYQSSSYLTDRVPELSFVDMPFLFDSTDTARGAMDGALGSRGAWMLAPYSDLPSTSGLSTDTPGDVRETAALACALTIAIAGLSVAQLWWVTLLSVVGISFAIVLRGHHRDQRIRVREVATRRPAP